MWFKTLKLDAPSLGIFTFWQPHQETKTDGGSIIANCADIMIGFNKKHWTVVRSYLLHCCEMVAEFIFTDMCSGAMIFDDVYICNLGGQHACNNFEIVSRKSRSLLRALG
jgi:hypothetical protein